MLKSSLFPLFTSFFLQIPRAKYTYLHSCDVETYLMALMKDMAIANTLAPVWKSLAGLMSHPGCQIISQIKIDLNFIEVLPRGRCFNIEKKCFEMDPPNLNGSPRNFVLYDQKENEIPYPKYFVEGMLNHEPF